MGEDIEAGVETTVIDDNPKANKVEGKAMKNITVISNLDEYDGDTLEKKVEAVIQKHGVVVFSKTWCPFSLDVKDFLGSQMGVRVYAIEIDEHPEGAKIHNYIKAKTNYNTVPVVFIKGKFIGGCDNVKALHEKGELERETLVGLIHRQRSMDTDKLETSKLVPVERSTAVNPPFWFPNTVNNYVVRLTGLQVFVLSALSAIFFTELWGRYLSVGLLVDFGIRLVAGSSVSPLGMIATVASSPFKPQFKPGPPKQFAAFCGVFFSLMSVIFYFVEFENHEYVGLIFMAMLACAAGLEAFFNYCLGCVFYGIGIQYGLFPDYVFRIHTATLQETSDSWDYMYIDSNAPKPEKVDTDPSNPIALKYKKKTDEWSKDDFDPIRNMQVGYFGMPLAITGLSVAFKIGSSWSESFGPANRTIIIPAAWFQVAACIGTFFFVLMLLLYLCRLILHPHRVSCICCYRLFCRLCWLAIAS
jgi:glutaredoxin 3